MKPEDIQAIIKDELGDGYGGDFEITAFGDES